MKQDDMVFLTLLVPLLMFGFGLCLAVEEMTTNNLSMGIIGYIIAFGCSSVTFVILALLCLRKMTKKTFNSSED